MVVCLRAGPVNHPAEALGAAQVVTEKKRTYGSLPDD